MRGFHAVCILKDNLTKLAANHGVQVLFSEEAGEIQMECTVKLDSEEIKEITTLAKIDQRGDYNANELLAQQRQMATKKFWQDMNYRLTHPTETK